MTGAVLVLLALAACFSAGGLGAWPRLAFAALAFGGLAAVFARAAWTGRPLRVKTALLLPLLALALVGAAGAALNPYPYGGLAAALDLAALAGAFLLAATASRREVSWALAAFLAGAAALGVYGLAQAAGLGFTPRFTPERVTSLFYNSNHYAGLLVLAIPLAVGWARASAGAARWGLLALAGLLLANLALTFSWGLIAVLLVLLAGLGRSSRGLWLGAGLAAAVGAAFFLLSPQLGAGDAQKRAGELVERWAGTSAEVRLQLARASLAIAAQNPLLGVGPGNYPRAYPPHRPPLIRSVSDENLHKRVNYAHNDYLQVAAETGLPGLLAFVAFWLMVLLRPAPPRPWSGGLRAALAALLLYGLTDGNMTYVASSALLAYVMAGLLHAEG